MPNAALCQYLNRRLHAADLQYLMHITDENYQRQLASFVHSPEKRIANNAAWILSHISERDSVVLQPFLPDFVELSMQTDDDTLRRLLLTVLHNTSSGEVTQNATFLNFCLDRLTTPTTPTGIRATCLKLAYRHCRLYPDLMQELIGILQFMDREPLPPAITCLRNKILKEYKK